MKADLNIEYPQKHLSIEQACEFLGVSKSYLYSLTHKRKIKYFKPTGKKIYFNISDLNNFVFSNPIETMEELEDRVNNDLEI